MPFFQSLQSFFGGSTAPTASNSRHQARRSVMNSTMDAFSLPTTTYAGARKNLPEVDSASSSPGPSRRGSTSNYTSYPPARDTYQPALTAYPPPSHTFHRLRITLSGTFPELLETLNSPVDPDLLQSFESELGCPLPPPVRDSFLVADGQDLESAYQLPNGGIFYGLHLLPLEEVMREWAFWRQAEHDPMAGQNAAVLATMASIPPTWIKGQYACRGWIPLLSDRTGNYVGVDLDPGSGGSWGQVIVFGRDFDRKCVLWKGEGEGGWGKWLAAFVDELESGEGWEADKSHSSDEDEEAGYTSYTGNQSYGEEGKGMRLAGEYRGWNVLEAWWDRSARQWEQLGLGLDVEEVEKGLKEARRLAGYDENEEVEGKGKGRDSGERTGLGIGMGLGISAAQVDIPVLGSPQIPPPSTPTLGDSDVLLPPSSPDHPLPSRRVGLQQPTPTRVITPLPTNEHPLSYADPSGFLSPPAHSPPRRSQRRRSQAPAPTPLDLPTRADVQAMSAIHHAESSGLRGGWVMNLDTTGNARRGVGQGQGGRNSQEDRGAEGDMEDVDLEGGRTQRFGSAQYSDREMARQRDDEKLAMAGVEHRRASPNLLGHAGGLRSPSPLSRPTSPTADYNEPTPRAAYRDDRDSVSAHPAVVAASNRLRRPPPIANSSDPSQSVRSWTLDEERDREVIRSAGLGNNGNGPSRPSSLIHAPRVQREASTASLTSEAGLLDRDMGPMSAISASHSRASSPPIVLSPAQMYHPDVANAYGRGTGGPGSASARSSVSLSSDYTSGRPLSGIRLIGSNPGLGFGGGEEEQGAGLEEGMEEISLEDPSAGGQRRAERGLVTGDKGGDGREAVETKRRSWVRA